MHDRSVRQLELIGRLQPQVAAGAALLAISPDHGLSFPLPLFDCFPPSHAASAVRAFPRVFCAPFFELAKALLWFCCGASVKLTLPNTEVNRDGSPAPLKYSINFRAHDLPRQA